MRVIDSSVWIEILADGPYAERLLEEVPAVQDIAMPTMIELELARWIAREGDTATLRKFLAFSSQCISVPPDTSRALVAARVHREFRLATADALVYAAALEFEAELVTCDRQFENLPHVIYLPNK